MRHNLVGSGRGGVWAGKGAGQPDFLHPGKVMGQFVAPFDQLPKPIDVFEQLLLTGIGQVG